MALLAMPEGVLVIDSHKRIVMANPAASAIFGYPTLRLVEMALDDLVPLDRRPAHSSVVDHYLSAPVARPVGVNSEVVGLRADGLAVALDVTLTPVVVDAHTFVVAVIRNESGYRSTIERLRAAQEITELLFRGQSTNDALTRLLARCRELSQADVGMIVRRFDRADMEVIAADGAQTSDLVGVRLDATGSLTEQSLRDHRTIVADDVTSLNRMASRTSHLDFGPTMVVPLVHDESEYGSVVLVRRRGGATFRFDEIELVEAMAAMVLVAIEIGELREEAARQDLIAEDERIARDLHDSVIQELYAVAMSVEALRSTTQSATAERLGDVVETIDRVIRDIRTTIFRLPRRRRERVGLRDALLVMVEHYSTDNVVTPTLHFVGPIEVALDDVIKANIIHVVSEALSNVARHAQSHAVQVSVAIEGDDVIVLVVDDGVGLAPDLSYGSGLINMRQRAEDLGGTFGVATVTPHGLALRWSVPI